MPTDRQQQQGERGRLARAAQPGLCVVKGCDNARHGGDAYCWDHQPGGDAERGAKERAGMGPEGSFPTCPGCGNAITGGHPYHTPAECFDAVRAERDEWERVALLRREQHSQAIAERDRLIAWIDSTGRDCPSNHTIDEFLAALTDQEPTNASLQGLPGRADVLPNRGEPTNATD